jgi:hypothetical protein
MGTERNCRCLKTSYFSHVDNPRRHLKGTVGSSSVLPAEVNSGAGAETWPHACVSWSIR